MPDDRTRASVGQGQQDHSAPDQQHPGGVDAEPQGILAVGSSAGGLEACSGLLEAMPAQHAMAIIMVQHLDPSHRSLMVDLLARHTAMRVVEAVDGMPILARHVYVIAPGAYLSVQNRRLSLSPADRLHGARMPFDALLPSLAKAYGARVIAIVLSGTGSDGAAGLASVRQAGGLVLAQDPEEAAFDGMPRNAHATGNVDQVVRLADMPGLAIRHVQPNLRGHRDRESQQALSDAAVDSPDETAAVDAIIDLLKRKTVHDFSGYRRGTIERRIKRRISATGCGSLQNYQTRLESDEVERMTLANELLINVTAFFRDAKTFALLESQIIPDMLRHHPQDEPFRVWIAGCSTGEEAYSIAILLLDAMTASGRPIKLQLFASDADADALSHAREGLYPASALANVSPERIQRYFVNLGDVYRVKPDLRAMVVFTEQDILVDPPFSRLDWVSCRNLLIYLGHVAQEKVIALLHFALKPGGLLLLGSAEAPGQIDGRFTTVAATERIFRKSGTGLSRGSGTFRAGIDLQRPSPPQPGRSAASTKIALAADICRQSLIDAFVPASLMINAARECLYSVGPIGMFLDLSRGYPPEDVIEIVPLALRMRLIAALATDPQESLIRMEGGLTRTGEPFTVEIRHLDAEMAGLKLLSFMPGTPAMPTATGTPVTAPERKSGPSETVSLAERQLLQTRAELLDAVRALEIMAAEHKAIELEALSVNEEFQATNEELLASKEELQSLNEELSALNSQLHETLERQRATANDLQNILRSTDVATLFLDLDLNIRYFTPATRALFRVIQGDIGRPLADLASRAIDPRLVEDAKQVLETLQPRECEITTMSGDWFIRRILPYRSEAEVAEGLVITFTNISERKDIASALEAAKAEADRANIAKSRFLAAASHDLRQPLQSLTLLQGLLERQVESAKGKALIARFGQVLFTITGLMNTLLDINQIEAGVVVPQIVSFPVNDLLKRIRDDFLPNAQIQQLELRVVRSSRVIRSDPRLLEQIVRNLISNALKYTKRGKILIGCRQRQGKLAIEVWDTGIGIPQEHLQAIFQEYHQINNDARERNRGLGLGLAIVQRLGTLLGHAIGVRSRLDHGSVFAIEVALSEDLAHAPGQPAARLPIEGLQGRKGHLFVVEDDPTVSDLLAMHLSGEGHRVDVFVDGPSALASQASPGMRPDLLLADYNLPNGLDGLSLAREMRQSHGAAFPVIILTGDVSAQTLQRISAAGAIHRNKPISIRELSETVQSLLNDGPKETQKPAAGETPVALKKPEMAKPSAGHPAPILIVDDDPSVREHLVAALREAGLHPLDFETGEALLASGRAGEGAALLLDAYLPGMSGLDLLQRLRSGGNTIPTIIMTGHSDVAMAVAAMKAGASDFIEKPVQLSSLLASLNSAQNAGREASRGLEQRANCQQRLSALTPRQREIMMLVLDGHPSKNIAADLHISQRTVENHRAAIMKKTGATSLAALARLAYIAAQPG